GPDRHPPRQIADELTFIEMARRARDRRFPGHDQSFDAVTGHQSRVTSHQSPVTSHRRLGTSAIARTGPPLPPSIFMGNAITVAPTGGSSSRLARFSSPPTFCAVAMR